MAELSKATGNFDKQHEIGAGGFGKVFYGTLADGKMVAIKRASTSGLQGQIEFRNEVNLLSRLHHRHLVRLEGFCDEHDLQVTLISEGFSCQLETLLIILVLCLKWLCRYILLHRLHVSIPMF